MRKIIPEEGRELLGSPIAGIEGDVILYNVDMGAPVTLSADPAVCWMHVWKGTQDVSASVLSGSLTANGNILQLMSIQNEVAAEYRYTFKVSVNGQWIVYFFRRKVERESGQK